MTELKTLRHRIAKLNEQLLTTTGVKKIQTRNALAAAESRLADLRAKHGIK